MEKKYEKFHELTSKQLKIIGRRNFTYKIILNIIEKYLRSTSLKVLDIGCGAGTISFYIANRGNRVVGIDIAKKAIHACNQSAKILSLNNLVKFRNIMFPEKVPSEKFDLVICSEVIEHIRNDDLAIRKIYTVLNYGGLLILSTPSKNAPLYKLGLVKDFDKRVGHLRRYSVRELSNLCKKNGFKILETKKTEGILRNFLFLNPIAGKFIRFIKFFLVDIVSFLDNVSLRLFGESQLFVVAQKV